MFYESSPLGDANIQRKINMYDREITKRKREIVAFEQKIERLLLQLKREKQQLSLKEQLMRDPLEQIRRDVRSAELRQHEEIRKLLRSASQPSFSIDLQGLYKSVRDSQKMADTFASVASHRK